MHLHHVKLLRIVAEKRLTADVVRLLTQAGIRGYTILDATGFGAHGERPGGSDDTANVVNEAVAADGKAEVALHHIHEQLFGKSGLIAYLVDAQVMRREKFQ